MLQTSPLATRIQALLPGATAAIVIAIAAHFLAEHYGASAMLFALLLGMALNFLGQEGRTVAGVQWSASTLLRVGVALLGLRITTTEIAELGWGVTAMVVGAVARWQSAERLPHSQSPRYCRAMHTRIATRHSRSSVLPPSRRSPW